MKLRLRDRSQNTLLFSSCVLHLKNLSSRYSITVGTHTGMVKFASAPMVKVFWTRTLALPISLEIKVQYSTVQYSTVPGGHVAQGGVVQTVPEVVMHLVWPHAEVGVLDSTGMKHKMVS